MIFYERRLENKSTESKINKFDFDFARKLKIEDGWMVAYDPRRHQGMTLRRRRSRHPRASSPLDRRRRRMPSFTTPSEDLISPRHISQGSRARGVIFPVFYFIMNFISPHVFKRAFAYLLLSLLGFRVGSFLFSGAHSLSPSLCGPFIFLWLC